MAGHVVIRITEHLAGGEPLRTAYAVAEPNQHRAIALFKLRPDHTADEQVEAVAELTQSALDSLGLKPGMSPSDDKHLKRPRDLHRDQRGSNGLCQRFSPFRPPFFFAAAPGGHKPIQVALARPPAPVEDALAWTDATPAEVADMPPADPTFTIRTDQLTRA